MKLNFITIFLLFNKLMLSQVVVNSHKLNVAYLGVDNPLQIMMENTPCKDIEVSVNNGTLERLEDCNFNYRPSASGKAIFSIYSDKDSLKYEYRILRVPESNIRVSVGGILAPKILDKNLITAQIGLIATIDNFPYISKIVVKEYTFILCSSENYYLEKVKGNLITNTIREKISNTNCIDEIIFDNIVLEVNDLRILKFNEKLQYFLATHNRCDTSNICISDSRKLASYSKISNDTIYSIFSCPCNKFIEKIESDITIYNGLNFDYYDAYKIEKRDSLLKTKTYHSNGNIKVEKIDKQYNFNRSITHLYDGFVSFYPNNDFLDFFYREFYENGNLKVIGYYDLKPKIDTIDVYYTIIPKDEDAIKSLSETKAAVKHGIWLFYNEKGKILRKEVYNLGVIMD